jgi:hypothetical protein
MAPPRPRDRLLLLILEGEASGLLAVVVVVVVVVVMSGTGVGEPTLGGGVTRGVTPGRVPAGEGEARDDTPTRPIPPPNVAPMLKTERRGKSERPGE